MVPLFLAQALLVIAFSLGVWASADQWRDRHVLAGLLLGFGAICLAGPFTPRHRREALAAGAKSLTDTLHIMGAAVDVLLILLIIGFGAAALGPRFRFYSMGTWLVVLGFGAWAGLDAPRLEADLPTPWVGVKERISNFAFLLWVVVLAIGLRRAQITGATNAQGKPAVVPPTAG